MRTHVLNVLFGGKSALKLLRPRDQKTNHVLTYKQIFLLDVLHVFPVLAAETLRFKPLNSFSTGTCPQEAFGDSTVVHVSN